MSSLDGKDILRLKGMVAGRPLTGPRSVNIHLTNVCNLHCRFCWYHSPLVSFRDKKRELDIDVFKRVVDDCVRMDAGIVNLEGGEVILYSRIEEAFRYAAGSGVGLHAYTNLAYGKAHLSYIALADRLNINFSAANRKSYQRIHGTDSYRQVLENIRFLKAMAHRRRKPGLLLTFIISEWNYREINGMLALADDLGVDEVAFRLFEATVEMKELIFTKESAKRLAAGIARALRSGRRVRNNLAEIYEVVTNGQFLENVFSIPRGPRNNDRLFYYHNLLEATTRCYTGWFYALIDERGRVIAPCDNIGVCIAGNVHKESFYDIWFHSGRFSRVRQAALHGIDTRKKKWRECKYCGHAAFNREIDVALNRSFRGGRSDS